MIEKYQKKDSVGMALEKKSIILKAITAPRKGWEESFQEMHENGDDQLLIPDIFEDESFDDLIFEGKTYIKTDK